MYCSGNNWEKNESRAEDACSVLPTVGKDSTYVFTGSCMKYLWKNLEETGEVASTVGRRDWEVKGNGGEYFSH